MMNPLLIAAGVWLAAVNLAGFALMGRDKSLARRQARRIPEARLFGTAAAGGALGVWLGMRTFRHKTKHASFAVGVPLLLLWNAAVVYMVLTRLFD
jgi:uncharacterized membrane protein YsdA (DUF1294 family)